MFLPNNQITQVAFYSIIFWLKSFKEINRIYQIQLDKCKSIDSDIPVALLWISIGRLNISYIENVILAAAPELCHLVAKENVKRQDRKITIYKITFTYMTFTRHFPYISMAKFSCNSAIIIIPKKKNMPAWKCLIKSTFFYQI